MAYVDPNYKTKADLKKAVKDGKVVRVFSPGPFPIITHGALSVEGPHYPQPHTWYARVEVRDGVVVKVIS
jgi:hydroxyacyl-ACP dehydratase HTD2-like protein with hotdog domain